MKAETYSALLKDLQKLQKALVAAQIKAVRLDPGITGRMALLHAEAEVGGRLDDFIATAIRKSTVLFLLRTVFVRVLEDLGILGVKRFRDEWGFAAFREVAPALGRRAYFAFVFRDLAVDFPALFTPSDDEVPLPDEDGCVALWNLWHHPNRDGEVYIWDGDGFDSHFLGELYQALDADIRKRYALLQTPPFVRDYILDHTLTPALADFDPATLHAAGQTFRVIDPTCGSGHFLIGAFQRLANYWHDQQGLWEWQACERALEGVWGCDINPHAVEIAAFRLLLEVVARTGVKDLERLAALKLHLRTMDSLIPWEGAVGQIDLYTGKDRLDTYATSKQRDENASFLKRQFHVVVGNPPYITPKDAQKRDDYRIFWPHSAAGKYALSAPFAERFFQLCCTEGFVGQITSNSFMKRRFGKKLVETSFPKWDLTMVVDTSGARIPGHGTPTVVIFGRSAPPSSNTVAVIAGMRGEPRHATGHPHGIVWQSLVSASSDPNSWPQNEFVAVAQVARDTLSIHPWTIGDSQQTELLDCIGNHSTLKERGWRVGFMTILQQDEVYLSPPASCGGATVSVAKLGTGSLVRDYTVGGVPCLYPYSPDAPENVLIPGNQDPTIRHFWSYRTMLWERGSVGFRTVRDRGMVFYEYPFYYPETFLGFTITYPDVSSHHHFTLARGAVLFNRTAPAIRRSSDPGTEDDHLDVLGILNSSTLEFWGKRVFHNKGYSASGGSGRVTAEDWDNFYQRDATKLQGAPIATRDRDTRVALARALDTTAQERAECMPAALLSGGLGPPTALGAALSAAHDRFLAHTCRMVALQEELDWLTYGTYDLIEPITVVSPSAIEPVAPGHRPFEIVFARKDDDADDDEKSAWWSRHRHDRVTEIPGSYSEAHRARLEQRIDLIESDPRLALLEAPPYKRRWEPVDWAKETKRAAESWLLDRLEDLFALATDTTSRGPLAEPKPYRLEDIAVAWSRDPRIAAVAGIWAGTGSSVDVTLVAEKLLRSNALPDNPHRLYSSEGLRKLADWKRVWALQDQEDAWDKAVSEAKARGEQAPKKRLVDPDGSAKELNAIPLPPKFDKADFVRPEFFAIRGKLNVPRERFILFADLLPNRYGWSGWRDRDRALAQVEAYTLVENDPQQPLPVPTSDDPRRCGVSYGLWESLPDVRRWGNSEEFAELQSFASDACRQTRCPCPVVEAWKSQVLHAKPITKEPIKVRGGKRKSEGEAEAERAQTVSLAERAWVASLFQAGKHVDAAGVWARHSLRLSDLPQPTLPGVSGPPVQLMMIGVGSRPPAELLSLDEARLALVLDDLVASGDIEVGGRGKKKRYLLVPRGVSS
jgi:hypothetical protein